MIGQRKRRKPRGLEISVCWRFVLSGAEQEFD